MKTGDIVKHFGISESTVRRWVKEYEEFFSDSSNRQRSFTSSDFLVIATIKELANQNLPMSHIRQQLAQGYRVEDTVAQTAGYTDGRMVPAAAVEQIIDATQLRVALEQVTYERDRLLETLEMLEKSKSDLEEKYEERISEKDQQLQSLQEKISELQRELGRAEGELSYRRHLEEKPRRDTE
jgi:DNA-binding transcriptional MerR regulator